MSEDIKLPIESIIKAWKAEYGVLRTSDKGVEYVIIPNSSMRTALSALAQTFLTSGYTFDEIDDYRISVKIADIVWREDKIIKMSSTEVKRAKISLTKDWEEAIAPYSGIIISKPGKMVTKVEVKAEPKPKEKVLELDPKDRIKVDTSDIPDNPLDLAFLEELGISESDVSGGKK